MQNLEQSIVVNYKEGTGYTCFFITIDLETRDVVASDTKRGMSLEEICEHIYSLRFTNIKVFDLVRIKYSDTCNELYYERTYIKE